MLVSSSLTFMHVVRVSPSQNKVLICPYPKQCKHLLATACLCLSAWTQFALSCQLHYQPPWATLQLTASQLIRRPHLQLCCLEKAETDSNPLLLSQYHHCPNLMMQELFSFSHGNIHAPLTASLCFGDTLPYHRILGCWHHRDKMSRRHDWEYGSKLRITEEVYQKV